MSDQTPKNLIYLSDILKAETDYRSRTEVPAPVRTKMGDLVDYPPRKQKLVALSDERLGKVMVQPHNCTINLDHVNLGSVKADTLIKQGDAHGIKYIGNTADTTIIPVPPPKEPNISGEGSGSIGD